LTLPSNIIFPLRGDFSDFGDIDRYLRDLIFQLQRMYEDLAEGVNGDIKSSVAVQNSQWTPTLIGTTTPGSFTYTHQVGWVLRRGLMTDVYGDIAWSASGGAAGNLYVELPYQVANSEEMPFPGVVQPSSVTYTAGTNLVINAIPNTFRGEFWCVGTGIATTNQAVVATGRLIFHLRYLGVSDET
jgi:hypothetical protein